MSESISVKIQSGNFWGKGGAIADTRRLALLALNQPGSNLVDGLRFMIIIHTKALGYSKEKLKNASLGYRIRLWKKRQEKSERALWFYNLLWRILTFWNYV